MRRKMWSALAILGLLLLAHPGLAIDYTSKVEIIREEMYPCGLGHLHVPGYARNTADVTLKGIRVEGQVFDKQGSLLATKVVPVMAKELPPGESATFDLEFIEITQPHFAKVGNIILKVVQALPK